MTTCRCWCGATRIAYGRYLNVSRVKAQDAGDQTVRIRFQVADSGIGIDQQDLASLFTPFFQVDSSDTRRYGGTGLGLHIVKTLVGMMNGHIGVQSVVDQGSVFSVPNPGPTCVGTMPTAGTRVLVVDDNEIILRLVSRQLFTLGCRRVLVACNGKEAVSKFETSGPVDLILMDCQMPELDGCGATIALRDIESRSGNPFPVPIIAMTASAMYRDREMCLASVLHKWL